MHGRTSPIIHDGKNLFKGIPSPFAAVRYHSLIVSTDDVPSSLLITAWSSGSLDKTPIIMGLQHKSRPIWTVQFHPESICTDFGQTIVNNFINLVEDRWSTETSRPSELPMPDFLSDISAIPSPLICPNSPVTTNFKVLVNKLNFIIDSELVFKHFYSGEGQTNNFWLDSAKIEKGLSRYSFMGDISGPEGYRISYSLEHQRITRTVAGKSSEVFLDSQDSFFEHLSKIIHQSYVDRSSLGVDLQLPPFMGGLVGYIGYEMKSESL
jgi:para-aminobenzoate synthetase